MHENNHTIFSPPQKNIIFTHKIFKFQDSNRYIKLLKRVSALPGHSSVTE